MLRLLRSFFCFALAKCFFFRHDQEPANRLPWGNKSPNLRKDLSKGLTYWQLLVLSVTPFKLDQNKNQTCPIRWSDREKKEGKYAKTLTKIRVIAIFLSKKWGLFGDRMLELNRMGSNMAVGNQEKDLSMRSATKRTQKYINTFSGIYSMLASHIVFLFSHIVFLLYEHISPNFQNCAALRKRFEGQKHDSLHLGRKYINNIAAIWRENIPGYLSLDIICSSKLTNFLELRSRKTYFRAKWRLLFT